MGRGMEEPRKRRQRLLCNPSPDSGPEGLTALVPALGRAMVLPYSEGLEGHPTFPGL